MIMDQEVVQAPGLMGRVMVEEIPVEASTVIRVDITIKVIRVTKVAIIIRQSAAAAVGLPEQPEAVE